MSAAAPETERPSTRTASMCAAAESARVTHSFKVVGSSVHKGFAVGMFVRSATFSAGGHDWSIRYYPNGNNQYKDHAAVFLELMTQNTEATVLFDFRLVNQATGLSSSFFSTKMVFNDETPNWGPQKFVKKSDLEALGYLKDECLEIECDLAVVKVDEIDVPPPNLQDDLQKLLESEEGVDVTFRVQEEVFRAHRIVLAMRSPVFKAELCGPMRNSNEGSIVVVEDMEPPAFKALLHFIYTDSLPVMNDLDAADYQEMSKHLLVAADRYGLDRMKLMCENALCKKLAVDSVAATLILADQYHCSKLKDACFRFINSSNRMDDVVASQGYKDLKRECPALTMEILEEAAKSCKI